MKFIFFILSLLISSLAFSQSDTKLIKEEVDSLYIEEYEDGNEPDKVLHAEPLYIDLIRDLGARKGEKEWNLGIGIMDNLGFDSYEVLIEYEFAPINRLGFEVEIPFTFYSSQNSISSDSIPGNQLDAIQLAAQWTFFVSEKIATSMALGYINAFIMNDFKHLNEQVFIGNSFNPFFVIAKRWGNNFHTLIYTGPVIEVFSNDTEVHTAYELNANIHYMISGTRNFIGIEFNQQFYKGDFGMTIRPQMRVDVADNMLIGIVTGIPIDRENERFSAFLRVIWEPTVLH